jgi:hypothetical protein
MNTHSAREYTMFAPAQFLRNWREQRPSNQDALGSSVMRQIGRFYHAGGGRASDFIFMSFFMSIVGLHFKWHTLCMKLRV